MTQARHIAFFGASVTEQNVHHATNELTGFVTYFEENLADKLGCKVSRVSAGSSDLMDAGVIYVEKVLELRPDICIIDWATPALQDCDPRIVQQIYHRLMEYDILPVTMLFLRRDRVQKDIPIAREMARIAARHDLPFFDAQEMLAGQDVEAILRDVVHTTPEGARVYAGMIADILARPEVAPRKLDKPRPPFTVLTAEPETTIPISCKKIAIDIKTPTKGDVHFCFVLEQRVGPYSPLLEVALTAGPENAVKTHSFPIFDAWCHRERHCIKRIMDWHTATDLTRVEFSTSQTLPNVRTAVEIEEPTPAPDRHLKPRGQLYIVADRPVICTAKYT